MLVWGSQGVRGYLKQKRGVNVDPMNWLFHVGIDHHGPMRVLRDLNSVDAADNHVLERRHEKHWRQVNYLNYAENEGYLRHLLPEGYLAYKAHPRNGIED